MRALPTQSARPPSATSREQVVTFGADGEVSVLGSIDTLRGDGILPGFSLPLSGLFEAD